LSRWFRFYEKKRGHRRTVPQRFGSVGELLFFGFFLCVGCGALSAMVGLLVWPEWRANRQFAEVTATVLGKRMGVAGDAKVSRFRPEINIVYEVGGQTYTARTYRITGLYSPNREQVQAELDQFQVGQQYPAWYDPMQPGRAVLVRGYTGWLYVILLVPVSFIAIASRRLMLVWLNWGTSSERRAAMTKRAAEFELFELAGPPVLPTVPSNANLTNSPGTRLAYRLPIDTASGWTLLAFLTACLCWNGVLSVFLVMAVRTHLAHRPDWLMTLLVIGFVPIGVALIYFAARQFWITTGIGSTRIEISHHPLYPGEEYEIFISQAGRLTMNSLRVLLVCEERATYRQGTDTRTDSRRVHEQPVFGQENFDILDGIPFEGQGRLRIPPCAMHSFKSDHNEVGWRLVVRGDAARQRDYERVFPVIVHPASGGGRAE
jgi:hypothetical protein